MFLIFNKKICYTGETNEYNELTKHFRAPQYLIRQITMIKFIAPITNNNDIFKCHLSIIIKLYTKMHGSSVDQLGGRGEEEGGWLVDFTIILESFNLHK